MSRLQVVGMYVVVGGMMPPAAILLGDGAVRLFNDRQKVCGSEKAIRETFGSLCDYAFPANDAMLGYLMENSQKDGLPYPDELAAMAAAIVLGKPLNNGKDLSEGGLKVVGGSTPPRKPRPGGVALQIPQQALTS